MTAEKNALVCQRKINIKADVLSDWMMDIMRCLLFVTRYYINMGNTKENLRRIGEEVKE